MIRASGSYPPTRPTGAIAHTGGPASQPSRMSRAVSSAIDRASASASPPTATRTDVPFPSSSRGMANSRQRSMSRLRTGHGRGAAELDVMATVAEIDDQAEDEPADQ